MHSLVTSPYSRNVLWRLVHILYYNSRRHFIWNFTHNSMVLVATTFILHISKQSTKQKISLRFCSNLPWFNFADYKAITQKPMTARPQNFIGIRRIIQCSLRCVQFSQTAVGLAYTYNMHTKTAAILNFGNKLLPRFGTNPNQTSVAYRPSNVA